MKLNKNVHTPQKTQKGNWIKMCTLHRKHRKETKKNVHTPQKTQKGN